MNKFFSYGFIVGFVFSSSITIRRIVGEFSNLEDKLFKEHWNNMISKINNPKNETKYALIIFNYKYDAQTKLISGSYVNICNNHDFIDIDQNCINKNIISKDNRIKIKSQRIHKALDVIYGDTIGPQIIVDDVEFGPIVSIISKI